MGRYVFKLPDVGEGTAEAEIVAWHVKVGDAIEEDQNLVDVMTDKATVEMTSPVSGKVISLHGEPGQMAAVGSALVELEVEGAGNAAGNGKASLPVAKPAPTPKEKKDSLAPGGGEGRGEGASAATRSEQQKSLQQSPPHPKPHPPGG
jgi:2-oxoisovalerate dehydrogenase E2 component (dihydrolipoyl transacylase)